MNRIGGRVDVAVIGGGAVGLCAAIYLSEAGRSVTVFDAGRKGSASTGNAGMIVASHVVPLASPGVIASGLRWLLNRRSPFYIKPRLNRDLLRWLLAFRSACTPDHVRRSIPPLRDLSLASIELFEALSAREGMADAAYRSSGLLMLYHTDKGQTENLKAADLAGEFGLDVARLTADEVLQVEPGIRTSVRGGVLYRQDGAVDPNGLVTALRREAKRRGASLRESSAVFGFVTGRARVSAVETAAGPVPVDEVVIAAGAWSASLAGQLGLRLPLEPAKGYSITVETADPPVSVPHILTEEKLTVTPMPGRIRFAGTLSLSGFDGKVDARRIEPIKELARLYVAEAQDGADVWFGYRPCSPDGLPYIGRDPEYRNVTYATGHGMLGITHAPITGKLVAEILAGKKPGIDLTAFAPDR